MWVENHLVYASFFLWNCRYNFGTENCPGGGAKIVQGGAKIAKKGTKIFARFARIFFWRYAQIFFVPFLKIFCTFFVTFMYLKNLAPPPEENPKSAPVSSRQFFSVRAIYILK